MKINKDKMEEQPNKNCFHKFKDLALIGFNADAKVICNDCGETLIFDDKLITNKNCKECQFEKGHSFECSHYVEPKNPMKQPNENWEKLRKGYEEVQMVESSIEKAYPEAYRLARKFHKLYEEQAPFFGYITNSNSREFYPNSNNARLMAYVCFNIVEEEIKKARTETLEEILKCLPKTTILSRFCERAEENQGFNSCLEEIQSKIKELKDK